MKNQDPAVIIDRGLRDHGHREIMTKTGGGNFRNHQDVTIRDLQHQEEESRPHDNKGRNHQDHQQLKNITKSELRHRWIHLTDQYHPFAQSIQIPLKINGPTKNQINTKHKRKTKILYPYVIYRLKS